MKPVLLVLAVSLGLCTGVSLRGDVPAEDSRDEFVHIVAKRNESNSTWISQHIVPVAVGGGVGLLVVMCVVVSLVILCTCLYQRRHGPKIKIGVRQPLIGNGVPGPRYSQGTPREPSVVEAMNRERREKEIQEKKKATDSVQYFLRNNTQYNYESELNDLGSRMQKHWFKVTSSSSEDGGMLLLTTTPVSQKCPLRLDTGTQKAMNKLVRELRKHPFLQPIIMIEYLGAQQQLVIVQPLREGGSLKDTIYRATPTTDWSNKYSRRSKGLTIDRVKLYGRQILEAMLFLYDRGFPQLGHIQSGNVFIVNDVCLVGGYENTLLGYKTRMYKMCKEHIQRLDVIMFGHLLFEMCCGYELTSVLPSDQDYRAAKKEEVKDILQFVFKENQIEYIRDHEFFDVTLSRLDGFDSSQVKTTTGSVSEVLEKVRKGKPRQQKLPKSKKEGEPPPTIPEATPPPTREIDDVTPVNILDSPRRGVESEPGMGMDSAGNQSSDSNKEGKRKGRFRLGRGGKKKKESTPVADSGTDPDKTPIQPEQA